MKNLSSFALAACLGVLGSGCADTGAEKFFAGRRALLNKKFGKRSPLELGLSWLASVQNPDGTWGDAAHPQTALVLNSFLAAGETPISRAYGDKVQAGLRALARKPERPTDIQSQALRCLALCQAVNLGCENFREAAELSIGQLIDAHQHEGRAALSCWVYLALQRAHVMQCHDPRLAATANAILRHFEDVATRSIDDAESRVAVYYALQMSGRAWDDHKIRSVFHPLAQQIFEEDRQHLEFERPAHLSLWYFSVNAGFQEGGKIWKSYRSLAHDAHSQSPEGSYRQTQDSSDLVPRIEVTALLCWIQAQVFVHYSPAAVHWPMVAADASPLSPAGEEAEQEEPKDIIGRKFVQEAAVPILPDHYPARRASGRMGLTVKYGGSFKAQQELEKSLAWLGSRQNPDGSWGEGERRKLSALVLLSFITHGETNKSRLHGQTVPKALEFLRAGKNPDQEAAAIRTCALCEYLSISDDRNFEALGLEAVQELIAGIGEADSVATLGWTCQALRAAQIAHCPEKKIGPALDSCLERLLKKLPQDFAPKGKVGEESRATELHALLASSKAWDGKSLRPEFAPLAQKVFEEDLQKLVWPGASPQSLPGWYRGTYAAFQHGGKTWQNWRRKFEPMLRQNRQADGSWNPPGVAQPSAVQSLEATAYACLMLEVYYAYLRFPEQAAIDPATKMKPSQELP
ncbi:MAG: hypothetical protein RL095_3102 [Verrucomicrobiota bacterium]|jgi:hypothetical protein